MSRSNNTEIISPCQRFYSWSGDKGVIQYFDKSKGEKGENVDVKLPFTFLVLDRLHTIRGFNDAAKSGFWSNEVRDLKAEPFTVRNKNGVVGTGLYSNLAPILNQGAAYCQSIYIAVKEGGKLVLCNLQGKGSFLSEWFNLTKGKDIYKYAVTISGATYAKKGKTEYFTPNFKLNPTITAETEAEAIELDKVLQEYLTGYFKRNNSQQKESVKEGEVVISQNGHTQDIDELNTVLSNDGANVTEVLDDLPF
jgi:hypothetical protein